MKKIILVLLTVFCFCGFVGAADLNSSLDREAMIVTKPFLNLISDGLKEQDIKTISTGARAMMTADDAIYLCWIEAENGYYYYEMTIKMVNGNEELSKKYGL